MTTATIELSKPQKDVAHRAGHMQVIAGAVSGKTEAVSRRVAVLIGDGVEPASIMAFTFPERAAAKLNDRIINRVAEVKGDDFEGRLSVSVERFESKMGGVTADEIEEIAAAIAICVGA